MLTRLKTIQLAEANFKLEPRDLWIGVFWDVDREQILTHSLTVYVCPLPMLCIKLRFTWFTEKWVDFRQRKA